MTESKVSQICTQPDCLWRKSGGEEPAAAAGAVSCRIHGDPLVCLSCEAEEDARPEWQAVRPLRQKALRYALALVRNRIPLEGITNAVLISRYVDELQALVDLTGRAERSHLTAPTAVGAESTAALTKAAAAGSPPTAQERKVCEVCHEPCHHEGRACTCKDALRALIEKAQRFLAWEESPEFQACPRCDGKGYHHGFGDGGVDPDWCTSCGGPGQVPTEPGCWAAEDILAEFVEALLRQESSTT